MSNWIWQKPRSLVFLGVACYLCAELSTPPTFANYDYTLEVTRVKQRYKLSFLDANKSVVDLKRPQKNFYVEFDSKSGYLTVRGSKRSNGITPSLSIKTKRHVILDDLHVSKLGIDADVVSACNAQIDYTDDFNVKNLIATKELKLKQGTFNIKQALTVMQDVKLYLLEKVHVHYGDINNLGKILSRISLKVTHHSPVTYLGDMDVSGNLTYCAPSFDTVITWMQECTVKANKVTGIVKGESFELNLVKRSTQHDKDSQHKRRSLLPNKNRRLRAMSVGNHSYVQVENLKRRLATKTEELQALKAKLYVQALKAKLYVNVQQKEREQQWERKKQWLNKDITSLEQKLKTQALEIKRIQQRLKIQQSAAQQQAQQAEAEKKEKDEEIEELGNKLKTLESERDSVAAQVEKLRVEIVEHEKQNSEKASQVQGLLQTLSTQEQELKKMQYELDAQKSQQAQEWKSVKDRLNMALECKRKLVAAKINELLARIAALEAQNTVKESQVQELKEQLANQELEDNKIMEERISAKTLRVEKLKEQLDEINKVLLRRNTQIEKIKAEIAERQRRQLPLLGVCGSR